MASRRKKNDSGRAPAERRLNGMGMRRIMVLALIFGILTFLVLFAKLWQLQVVQHETLENKAVTQQTREISSTANRGTIYDSTGTILAISGSVQNVILSPRDVKNGIDVAEKDEFGNKRSEAVMDAERETKYEEIKTVIADGLSQILGVESSEILTRLEDTESAYKVVAEKVEDDIADQVRAFIDENDLEGAVYLTDDSKRYYPYSSLASHVVGFVNRQDKGAYGLEALYNSQLAGIDGKIITAKNASGTEMPTNYGSITETQDGYDIHTTIDATIQAYAEKTLEEGIAKFDVINGGFCLVMEPDTGAVLAMATSPEFDLNDPNTISDKTLMNKINRATTNEERDELINEARLKQWSNKALSTSYEPGSTFKPLVVAAALEEGAITDSDFSVTCTGAVQRGGWTIRCSARSGHGTQNLRRVVMNSCNPGLIKIADSLGADKFYQYWENFGFTGTTGIELPGEQRSVFWSKEYFTSPASITELATASFGQRFTTTPIQLITALSAVVNGGHLMEPYLVQSVTDEEGNVVSYHEPQEVRQVISQETSDQVRSYMESVVNGGSGKNARVAGYSIGGKTGSSQTLDSTDHIIVSFLGFAPADDPEVIVLLGYDWPQPAASGQNRTASGVYISGGDMAAPMAGELLAEIMDYMGNHTSGSTGTSSNGVTVPQLGGKTAEEARATLNALGINVRTSGEGEVVTDQAPSAGSIVPKGSSAVLYLGQAKPKSTVEMPDLSGQTYAQAKKTLEDLGLYLNATGSGADGVGKVFSQATEAGTLVEVGTSVEVKFTEETTADTPGVDGVDWAQDDEAQQANKEATQKAQAQQ